jgi:septal ring factor EnvC (AmiA/AmiB activator)
VIFKRSSIEKSEPATSPETTREPKGAAKGFHIWVIAGSSIVLAAVLSVAITLGIQNHNDRVLSARIAQSESELSAVGAQIASIKDHQFGTMSEYIDAYARVEPLLKDYDQKLQEYSELYNAAQQRDQKRRMISIQRMYKRYNPEVWRNTSEIIELVRQVNEVTKKEASIIRDMASLPAQEQVQFWHEEFMPLAAQEHALRERLLLVGQRVSPERATQ